MGRKVNPHGLRLGFNKDWSSHWFAPKSFAENLMADSKIRAIVLKKYQRSGIALIEIFRNRSELTVAIHTAKPGIIIGRSGQGALDLKASIDRALFGSLPATQRPILRLNIIEVKSPELSARIVADTIANQLERRISVKRAIRQAMERSMERRAKGIKIKVSGRLGGAEIARAESMSSGSIPLQTVRSDINYAQAEAKTTFGIIGVKVWIYLGESDKLPMETAEQQPARTKSR